jgi:hypothetical protein
MNRDYIALSRGDIVTHIRPLLDAKAYFIRDPDGLIDCERRIAHNSPWIYVRPMPAHECGLWSKVYYPYFHFIPKFCCYNCWKVVIKPKNIRQMARLHDLMIEMGRYCKLGKEEREYVSGPWGGYFYNTSVKEGRARWKEVYERVERDPILKDILDEKDKDGYPVRLYLKRGCTEYEINPSGQGPSDKWVYTKEHEELQHDLDIWFVHDTEQALRKQPEHLQKTIWRSWEHWASKWEDKTLFDFTRGKLLFRPPVTYHKEG